MAGETRAEAGRRGDEGLRTGPVVQSVMREENPVDAIQLVKKDHRTVEQLFKEFEKAARTGRKSSLRRIVRELTRELSVHASIEEQILYPALRREERSEDDVLEALEEHHLVKLTLAELEAMEPENERYCAKVMVLVENVRHHVEEEEDELLPRLRKAFSPADLKDLGELMARAKKVAPTRPHPGAPDEPPGNLVTGALSAILDRGRDALREMADRGRAEGKRAVRRGRKAAGRLAEAGVTRARRLAGRGNPTAEVTETHQGA